MQIDPESRLLRLERQLERVQNEINRARLDIENLRGDLRAPDALEVEEPEAQSPPEPVVTGAAQPDSATLRHPPVAEPVRPPPPAARPPRADINWEAIIGANWMNRIGVLILLLAGVFLIHLAWQRGWVHPVLQVAGIFATGVGLVAGGEVFRRRKLPVFAQGLTSLGILALYAGGLVGYQLHEIFQQQHTFVIYAVITVAAFLLAARSNSVAVVLLGSLGGYLTPVILSTGRDETVAFFTYLLFLNVGISATAIFKRWRFLNPIAFVATVVMFLGWALEFYDPSRRWALQTMMSLHAGVFLVAGLVPLAALRRPTVSVDRWMVSKTSLVFFGMTYLLFESVEGHRLGEFAALYALGHWALAGGIYALRRQRDRMLAYLLGLGAVYLTAAVPIYFESADYRAIAWAAQGLVFTVIGIRYGTQRTIFGAALVYALAVWWTMYHQVFYSHTGDELLGLDGRFAIAVIVSALVAGGGLAFHFGRPRVVSLARVNSPLIPFVFLATADVVLASAGWHQFHGQQLALAWTANAVLVCCVAHGCGSAIGARFGLLLLAPAFARFVHYQVVTPRPLAWQGDVDERFVYGLIVVVGGWVAAFLARAERKWRDLPDDASVAFLATAALLMFVVGLQWDGVTLTVVWACVALAPVGFARRADLPRVAWCAAAAIGVVALRWVIVDANRPIALSWLPAVREGAASGAIVAAAGFLSAWLLRPQSARGLSGGLALACNLLLLAVIAHQWDGHWMLTLWACDVAALWAIGFRWRSIGARTMALALWMVLLGGWIVANGIAWRTPLADFHVLVNGRFGSLLCVGVVGLAATWAYRRFGERRGPESGVHNVCVVLANLLIVGALSLEVDTLFKRFVAVGGGPAVNLPMARQATLSILWTAYAAALFLIGFVARYKPVRILSMVSLGPIVLKVFLVDLRDLDVVYRVVSFAVLGLVFVGVSYLYQRFQARVAA